MHYNVLIVDDEEAIKQVLGCVVDRMNRTYTTAKTVQSALSLLCSNTFDLAFIDMFLPDGKGIELIEKIREKQPSIATNFVLITGEYDYATFNSSSDFFSKLGIRDVMLKPIRIRNFMEVISKICK